MKIISKRILIALIGVTASFLVGCSAPAPLADTPSKPKPPTLQHNTYVPAEK